MKKTRLKPLGIVSIYAVVSALWILFSDRLVAALFSEHGPLLLRVNTLKGWFYVAVISCLLYVMLKRFERRTMAQAAAIREREERYRLLFENAGDAIYLARMDGTFSEVNSEAERQTGYTRAELLTMGVEDVDADETGQPFEAVAGRIREQGRLSFERVHRRKDGTLFPVEVRAAYFESDGTGYVFGLARDVTERKAGEQERHRLHEAMVQSEKMMSVGGLAAGMAHEINNPLGGILQSTQVLTSRLRDELPANLEQAREAGCDMKQMGVYFERRGIFDLLGAIRECAARAARIVGDMLEFSRKSTSALVPSDLNAIMDKALGLAEFDLESRYDFKSIRIEKQYQADLPPTPCNPTEIEQVVLNLLKNAAHAVRNVQPGARPPAIALRTRAGQGRVFLEVEDNGPGMEPEVAKRVFEPFFTTKETGQGTGLGLSVSYFIVSSHHGGLITVKTEPGAGAVFTVELPL